MFTDDDLDPPVAPAASSPAQQQSAPTSFTDADLDKPAAPASPAHDDPGDWITAAPQLKNDSYADRVGRIAGDAVSDIGKRESKPLDTSNPVAAIGDIGDRAVHIAGDMGTAAASTVQGGLEKGYKSLINAVAPNDSEADREQKSRDFGDVAVGPVTAALPGAAKNIPKVIDAIAPTEGMPGYAFPKGAPPVTKDVAAWNNQKSNNIDYVEGINANAENMKQSYGNIYNKAGDISKDVTVAAPKVKTNVQNFINTMEDDPVHNSASGSSQAYRDLQAVADSFDENGNIPLDQVTLLKRRVNDLYGSDMDATRGAIYKRLNSSLNDVIKQAKGENPEWGSIMDSGNALFNNYRSTFDSAGASNKKWSLGDKKEYEDAYRALNGDPVTDMPGDPTAAPVNDETRQKIYDFHKVDSVAQFESTIRKLPPGLRDQYTQDAVAASKEDNPRMASLIRASYSAMKSNYGSAVKNGIKSMLPGDPGFNPNLADNSMSHVENAIRLHTDTADAMHGQYMDKLKANQDAAAAAEQAEKNKPMLALPAPYAHPTINMPAEQSGLYRQLPAPGQGSALNPDHYPPVIGNDGVTRPMNQQEMANYTDTDRKAADGLSRGLQVAQNERQQSQTATKLARARQTYAQNPRAQSITADQAAAPIMQANSPKFGPGFADWRANAAEEHGKALQQIEQQKERELPMPSVRDMLEEPRHADDIGELGRALLQTLRKTDGFARGGATVTGRKHIVDIDPTEAQKRAGNYKKAHINFHGLDISIENAKGTYRTGTDRKGEMWKCEMPAHYGYIKRTVGADGDHIDVYLGDDINSRRVYIVDQKETENNKFDEHKAMLGYASKDTAVKAYRSAFSDKKDRIMKVTRMSIGEFKSWLKQGDTRIPAHEAA